MDILLTFIFVLTALGFYDVCDRAVKVCVYLFDTLAPDAIYRPVYDFFTKLRNRRTEKEIDAKFENLKIPVMEKVEPLNSDTLKSHKNAVAEALNRRKEVPEPPTDEEQRKAFEALVSSLPPLEEEESPLMKELLEEEIRAHARIMENHLNDDFDKVEVKREKPKAKKMTPKPKATTKKTTRRKKSE